MRDEKGGEEKTKKKSMCTTSESTESVLERNTGIVGTTSFLMPLSPPRSRTFVLVLVNDRLKFDRAAES